MDLEGEGGTTVGVDELKEIVLMIVVTTDGDRMMGGGITIIEMVLITSLLLIVVNVDVATEGIVTRIVEIIGTVGKLGWGVEMLVEMVEPVDVLFDKTIVGVMLFVTLTKLLEIPREGVVVF